VRACVHACVLQVFTSLPAPSAVRCVPSPAHGKRCVLLLSEVALGSIDTKHNPIDDMCKEPARFCHSQRSAGVVLPDPSKALEVGSGISIVKWHLGPLSEEVSGRACLPTFLPAPPSVSQVVVQVATPASTARLPPLPLITPCVRAGLGMNVGQVRKLDQPDPESAAVHEELHEQFVIYDRSQSCMKYLVIAEFDMPHAAAATAVSAESTGRAVHFAAEDEVEVMVMSDNLPTFTASQDYQSPPSQLQETEEGSSNSNPEPPLEEPLEEFSASLDGSEEVAAAAADDAEKASEPAATGTDTGPPPPQGPPPPSSPIEDAAAEMEAEEATTAEALPSKPVADEPADAVLLDGGSGPQGMETDGVPASAAGNDAQPTLSVTRAGAAMMMAEDLGETADQYTLQLTEGDDESSGGED
jgi:hypothetical protein